MKWQVVVTNLRSPTNDKQYRSNVKRENKAQHKAWHVTSRSRMKAGVTHLRDVAGRALVVGRHRHREVTAEVVSGVLKLVIARLDTGRWGGDKTQGWGKIPRMYITGYWPLGNRHPGTHRRLTDSTYRLLHEHHTSVLQWPLAAAGISQRSLVRVSNDSM